MSAPDASAETLRLRRVEKRWQHRAGRYRIIVDGVPCGLIGNGETVEIPIDAGAHRVRLRVQRFYGSRELSFSVRSGEVVEFWCEPGWPMALEVLALFVPRRYLSLRLSAPAEE